LPESDPKVAVRFNQAAACLTERESTRRTGQENPDLFHSGKRAAVGPRRPLAVSERAAAAQETLVPPFVPGILTKEAQARA